MLTKFYSNRTGNCMKPKPLSSSAMGMLYSAFWWLTLSTHRAAQLPQQGGIHTYSLDSVTASEPSAVVQHTQFLSLACIHRCWRLFASLHCQCLTRATKQLWVLALPLHQQTQAASPLLMSFRPQTRFWSKIQEGNKKNKTYKQTNITPTLTINLTFCFSISYFTEQIRHKGTKVKRNVQTQEAQNSYRGVFTKGKARYRQGNCWFSSGYEWSIFKLDNGAADVQGSPLTWWDKMQDSFPSPVWYKDAQADRISHSESMDRTGQWYLSWIFRVRLWTSISAEQQRITH